LQLSAAGFAVVNQQVEGMFVMVAFFADLAQRRVQCSKLRLEALAAFPARPTIPVANCPSPLAGIIFPAYGDPMITLRRGFFP
jgi:hypothetical protein